MLFARVGVPQCPEHKTKLEAISVSDMTEKILKESKEENIMILSPIVKKQKGEHAKLIKSFQQQGYTRFRINKEIYKTDDISKRVVNPKKKNDIEIIIDRIKSTQENKLRITESLDTASEISGGIISVSYTHLTLPTKA